MADFTACPQCGTELPADAPAGICPRCLVLAGLQIQEDSGNKPPESAYAMTTPQPGSFIAPGLDLLAPHFPQLELGELLGQGGMGAVYKARQTKLDRTVALKIIRPESASDSAFAERFNREARTLARLSHPQIVGVHDFGEVKIFDPAAPSTPPVTLYYFLMEFVDGVNLRQLMEAGDLTPETTLSVISQICDALQFAHDEGIVHRDIKPENILLDRKGRVKIADFGLAKLASHSEQDFTLTGTHQVMGTPRYMAPEQMAGSRAVDHRADLYSLGVVFYEMLTGEIPAGHFSPPSQHAAIDGRLDHLVMKALAQRPDDRFQSASEIHASLEAIARDEAGSFLSEPEVSVPSPARGFSTIFEREIGAAWNWVVHPEKKSAGASNKNEAAAFPLLLFLTLSLLGGLTMLLPWAEIHVDQGVNLSSLVFTFPKVAELAKPVVETRSGTDTWSSTAAPITFLVLVFVIALAPSRKSPGIILSGVLTLLSVVALIHSLAFTQEIKHQPAITLPLSVSPHTAKMLRIQTGSGDERYDPVEDAAAPREVVNQRVSPGLVEHRVVYQIGFYAALGISLTLVVLNVVGVRNAILKREPKPKTTESWSGTPLASLRFSVPTQGDIGAKVKFHFAGFGYELVDEQPGAWIFQRGSAKGLLFWGTNLLTLPTRLSVYAIDDENGALLVNCHWSVRLAGGFATSNESRKLEDEGRQLQALLGGQLDEPADASISTASFGNRADGADLPGDLPRDGSRFVDDRGAVDLDAVEDEVSGPAIAMMVVGFLMMVGWPAIAMIAVGLLTLFGLASADAMILSNRSDPLLVWLSIPGLLVGLGMLMGGLSMKRLRSRVVAQMGAIAGMLPVHPAWLLTLPIGIWAQVMLKKSQVKRAFLENARRRRRLFSSSSGRMERDHSVAVQQTRRAVRGPGIALMLYGLVLLFPVVLLMTNGIDIADGNDGIPFGVGLAMVVGSLCLLGLCGLLIRGGWHMIALEKYNAALLASFLGQPVGLWSLMVLGRPEVKSAFASGPLPGVRQQAVDGRDRESLRAKHATTSPFARILLQFFTWVGILIAVSVVLYLARGGDEKSATPVYTESGAVPENEAGDSKSPSHNVPDAEQAARIRQLLAAAAAGDTGRVKTLLEAGIDVNSKDSEGLTPLMKAAAADESHLVALLMLRGADESLRDNYGKSALMHAVEAGHSSTVKLLIDMEKANWDQEFQFRLKRIDPNSTKTLDFKSLHFEGGQNWQDKNGETSLMKAAARGDLEMFDTLRLWSDERLRDQQGRTAIVHAIEQRQVEFLTKLLERAEQHLSVRTPGHGLIGAVTPEILSLPDNSRRTPLANAEEMELNAVAARIRSYLQVVVDLLSREIDATERVSGVKYLLIERARAFRGLGDDEQAEADLKRSREVGEGEK